MSWINIAGASVKAFGQYQAGQAAKQQGEMQAGQMNYEAGVDHDNGVQLAAMIRRNQRNAIGSADVAAAGSGVVVGSGSAGLVDKQIYQDSENDAYQAILNGDRRARAARVYGSGAKAAGDLTAANADMAASSTVLAGGYTGLRGSGWRTGGLPGYSGTQTPAPVVDRSIYPTS